jgi:DNA-binding Lrp family transcriptional regulator
MPEVEAAYSTSGRADLVLRIAAETTTDLDRVLDHIISIPGTKSTESLIHLSTKFDRTR